MRAEAWSRTPPTVGTHEGAGSQWCNRLLAEAKEVAFEALRCVVGGGVAVDGGPGGAGVRPGPDRAGSRTRQVHLLLLGPKRRARRPRRRGPDAVLRAGGPEGQHRAERGQVGRAESRHLLQPAESSPW